jgi:tetratricopeptide (TPR) repeat protein
MDPVGEALDLISDGKVDEALILLANQAEKDPSDSRVCFLLGQIAADRHHLSEALHWLSRTLVLNPLHLWAHYLSGLVGLTEGKIEDATQSFKKTIYIDASFALGHFYLGRIYKGRGDLKKARKSFAAVKGLLNCTALSEALPCTEGMTTRQLLKLVDEELTHEG